MSYTHPTVVGARFIATAFSYGGRNESRPYNAFI